MDKSERYIDDKLCMQQYQFAIIILFVYINVEIHDDKFMMMNLSLNLNPKRSCRCTYPTRSSWWMTVLLQDLNILEWIEIQLWMKVLTCLDTESPD